MRVITFLILITFPLVFLSCAKELLLPSIVDRASIPDFSLSYKLILKKTNEELGKASISLKSFKRQDKIFYRINQYTEIQRSDYTDYLLLESTSTTDVNFKLRVFSSEVIENKDTSIRKGYYNPPYYYIEDDGQKSRLRATKPLYSSLIEHYIIRNTLKKPNDKVSYFLFNLVSLRPEEESISFEREKDFIKEYKVINHKNNYTSFYKVDKSFSIVEKTDFANLIIWKIEN